MQDGAIKLGYQIAPFSYLDESAPPDGCSIDICLKVVDAIKREFKRPDLAAVKFVPVTSVGHPLPDADRRTIDPECANTPSTAVGPQARRLHHPDVHRSYSPDGAREQQHQEHP